MTASLTLEEQILVALRRITRAIDLRSRVLLNGYGLTAPQLAALKAINRLQPVSPGNLARSIHLGHPTVTGILNRLEARGLVVRARGSEDRRSVNVSLTDAGREILSRAPSPLQEEFLNELTKLQDWEQTQMLSNLQRIADMMNASDLDAAPILTTTMSDSTDNVPLHMDEPPDLAADTRDPPGGELPAPPSDKNE